MRLHQKFLGGDIVIVVLGWLFGAASSGGAAEARSLVPLREPDVRPLIAESYPEDLDHDLIADELIAEVEMLETAALASLVPEERTRAQGELDAAVDVELVFKRQISQEQIAAFTSMASQSAAGCAVRSLVKRFVGGFSSNFRTRGKTKRCLSFAASFSDNSCKSTHQK